MPKHHRTKSGDPIVKSGQLAESNPLSYEPRGRNIQTDYFRLENREKQLKALSSLTAAEYNYIMGGSVAGERATAVAPGSKPTDAQVTDLKNSIEKLHERDLVSLRVLRYVQSLPDSSPELFTLKAMCGCDSREQIADFIADKQMKKLIMSQVELIAGGEQLNTAYRTIIKRGPENFSRLFG